VNRRTLLAQIGTLGALGLAGCTGGDAPAGDGDSSPGNTTSRTGTPEDGTQTSPPPSTTPTPVSIVDQSIRTTATGCRGTGDETASVAIDREANRVTVTGVLHTPDPCHEATLTDVAYDASTATLSLDVAAVDTGEVCVQCTGRIDYEATVDLDGGVPDRVEITHGGRPIPQDQLDEGDSPTGTESDSGGGEDTAGTAGDEPVLDSSWIELRRTDDEPGTGGDVEFRPDAGEVVVTGWVEASNGCERPSIERVEYDDRGGDREGEFQVSIVAAVPPGEEDQACTQAIEALPYRATLAFADAIPTRVSLTQAGYGGVSAGYSSVSASEPTTTATTSGE